MNIWVIFENIMEIHLHTQKKKRKSGMVMPCHGRRGEKENNMNW